MPLPDEVVTCPPTVTDAAVVASPRPKRAGWGVWVKRAAALLVACGLSAAAASYLTRSSLEKSLLSRDLVTAHVRSLLQDTTVQVVSSDRHTVKPWFTGKTEFSPTVKDLSAEGFALVGGRLDYVGERRVAVVVYKRRQHVVNVFCWPSSAPAAAGLADKLADDAASLAINGYNGVQWYAGGMRYWAVSDLNPAELTQLQAFLSS